MGTLIETGTLVYYLTLFVERSRKVVNMIKQLLSACPDYVAVILGITFAGGFILYVLKHTLL